MHPDWPHQIALAQKKTVYTIDGVLYPRVRHGDEPDPSKPTRPCADCGVERGQLHVAYCDREVCPKCGGRALACGHING